MDQMSDHLDSTNLVPFKKRGNGYHLPGLTKEPEEQIIDEVDPELRPEEQGYVRHYLGYADIFLQRVEAEPETEEEPPAEPESNNGRGIPKARKDGHFRGHYKEAA